MSGEEWLGTQSCLTWIDRHSHDLMYNKVSPGMGGATLGVGVISTEEIHRSY